MRRLAAATGLLPFLDRPAGKLTGGMKQKLGLCCALIHDPDLLILDAPSRLRLMPMRRLLAYTQCETRSLLRDPIRLVFAFLGSFLMLQIFGYGVSSNVTNINYAAFDHDNTPESRAYLSGFWSSRYFTERPAIHSIAEMEEQLKSNDITLAIEIPPDFGRMVKRDFDWHISAWIDGADTSRASSIEGYVQQAHNFFAEQREREASSPSSSGPTTTILMRFRYNPTAESIYSIGPSVPAMLLMMFLAILTAVSVAGERESGTIANFYATPTTKLEFLIGKQLPYIGVGMANFAIMTATVVFLFGVPLKGDGFALTLGALAYVAAATGYGLFISTFTKSQVAAVFAGAVLSLLPTMQFSGMMQPVSEPPLDSWTPSSLNFEARRPRWAKRTSPRTSSATRSFRSPSGAIRLRRWLRGWVSASTRSTSGGNGTASLPPWPAMTIRPLRSAG